jgi:hypothetical protein
MGDIVLAGATSGTITLQPTAVAGSSTLTLPAANATVLTSVSAQSDFPPNIAGNGPAFRAYRNSDQTGVSSAVLTKVQFNLENFDTANCYDSTTNYRFTPNVAGYYQVNFVAYPIGTGAVGTAVVLYKNGNQYQYGGYVSGAVGNFISSGSALVYMNGSTDYLEVYGITTVSSGTVTFSSGGTDYLQSFSAALVRAA